MQSPEDLRFSLVYGRLTDPQSASDFVLGPAVEEEVMKEAAVGLGETSQEFGELGQGAGRGLGGGGRGFGRLDGDRGAVAKAVGPFLPVAGQDAGADPAFDEGVEWMAECGVEVVERMPGRGVDDGAHLVPPVVGGPAGRGPPGAELEPAG